MANIQLPPNPQQAVLKHIYPWDEYDLAITMQWLFAQAQKTGFVGTYEDFKLRYGAYVEAQDPQNIHELIENYEGTYNITPLVAIDQVLHTKNKVLNQDIIVQQIPSSVINNKKTYTGQYSVTPMADMVQQLRTADRVLEENIIIEKIPYQETSNDAGGYTAIIG